jgi:amino acid transporter
LAAWFFFFFFFFSLCSWRESIRSHHSFDAFSFNFYFLRCFLLGCQYLIYFSYVMYLKKLKKKRKKKKKKSWRGWKKGVALVFAVFCVVWYSLIFDPISSFFLAMTCVYIYISDPNIILEDPRLNLPPRQMGKESQFWSNKESKSDPNSTPRSSWSRRSNSDLSLSRSL